MTEKQRKTGRERKRRSAAAFLGSTLGKKETYMFSFASSIHLKRVSIARGQTPLRASLCSCGRKTCK